MITLLDSFDLFRSIQTGFIIAFSAVHLLMSVLRWHTAPSISI